MERNLARLGQTVKKRRESLGLTQAEVADRGGPSDTTLGGLESGTASAVSLATLRKLDRALEWSEGSAKTVLDGGDALEGSAAPRPLVRSGQAVETDALMKLSFATDALLLAVSKFYEVPVERLDQDELLTVIDRVTDAADQTITAARLVVETGVGGPDQLQLLKSNYLSRMRNAAAHAGRQITQSDYVLAQRAGETEYEIRQKTEPQAEDENQDNGSDEPA